MKQFLVFSFVIISFCVHSQNLKIDTGLYKSRSEGTEILLKLNEDKTFEMIFFHGTYTVENDSVRFNSTANSSSKFTVTPVKDAAFSSKLNLLFEGSLYSYYNSGIFIGTQKNANTQTVYKRFSDYLDPEDADSIPENVTIEVPKGQFLYLVLQNYEGGTEISKFEIGENLNQATVDFNPYSLNDIKLVGYVDEETKKLAITDTKKSIYFTYEKAEDFDKKSELQPMSVESNDDWANLNGFETTEYAYDSVYGESNFDFHHVIDNTFNDALSTLKKTPSKFLVVSYDLQNNKRENDFKTFIKASESLISSYMYNEYNAEYDNFNYYLATENDKKLMTSNNVNGSKELLVFNATGDLLYHTSGSLSDASELLAPYGSLVSALKKSNAAMVIDKLMTNKKATNADFISAFKSALSIPESYGYAYDAVATVAEPATEEEEMTVTDAAEEASPVDEAYSAIQDQQNLYALKSSKAQVQKQWNSLIDASIKSKSSDADFIQLVKRELSNNGFMNRLFESTSDNGLSATDFKLLDYVFDNYSTIIASEVAVDSTEEDSTYAYDPYDGYDQGIASILESEVFAYQNTSSEYVENSDILQKTLVYDKKYLDIVQPSFTAYYNYLNALDNQSIPNELNKTYLDAYADVFNAIIKKDANIIESLDENFSKKNGDDYNNWSDFKYQFATSANSAAWHVVENAANDDYLKKAIHWSETSLSIDKTSNYYLDTLAQLYYKDRQKDKAILTEQKAIDMCDDYENKAEYELVLTKMKNGSY